jgi:hypothetical protein
MQIYALKTANCQYGSAYYVIIEQYEVIPVRPAQAGCMQKGYKKMDMEARVG